MIRLQGGHVPADDRLKLARDAYGAYESGDRRAIEELLADDFTFYSPADPAVMEHLLPFSRGPRATG